MPRAEVICAANCMDSKIVEERFSDRLKVLPFRRMETSSVESSQQGGIEASLFKYIAKLIPTVYIGQCIHNAGETTLGIHNWRDGGLAKEVKLMTIHYNQLIKIVSKVSIFILISPEFLERRAYWTQYLYELVSVVKPRTIKTNYAIDYAICEKMYSIFRY